MCCLLSNHIRNKTKNRPEVYSSTNCHFINCFVWHIHGTRNLSGVAQSRKYSWKQYILSDRSSRQELKIMQLNAFWLDVCTISHWRYLITARNTSLCLLILITFPWLNFEANKRNDADYDGNICDINTEKVKLMNPVRVLFKENQILIVNNWS